MVLDWTQGALADGLACYRRNEFFLCHEHWEMVWLQCQEPEKSFLQALIQITAAFHHWQNGNSRGAVSLLRKALRRLQLCPVGCGEFDVASLHSETELWLQRIERQQPCFPATFPAIGPR